MQAQTLAGMGQGQESMVKTESNVENLGVARALRRVVVEQHDPATKAHGPGRPGENRQLAEQLAEVEKAHPVEQNRHMAASNADRCRAPQQSGNFGAVPSDRRPPARRPTFLEFAVHRRDPFEVLLIEQAYRFDRLAPRRLEQGVVAIFPAHQLAGGFEGEFEAEAVEPLQRLQTILACPVGFEKLGIFGENLVRPRMQAQVDHRATQVFLELVVLRLPLLPTGSDRRYRAGDAAEVELFTKGRFEALWTKEGERLHRLRRKTHESQRADSPCHFPHYLASRRQGQGKGPRSSFGPVRFLAPKGAAGGPKPKLVAEGVGFEPTDPCGSTVFKTAAIGRSAIPPLNFAWLPTASRSFRGRPCRAAAAPEW